MSMTTYDRHRITWFPTRHVSSPHSVMSPICWKQLLDPPIITCSGAPATKLDAAGSARAMGGVNADCAAVARSGSVPTLSTAWSPLCRPQIDSSSPHVSRERHPSGWPQHGRGRCPALSSSALRRREFGTLQCVAVHSPLTSVVQPGQCSDAPCARKSSCFKHNLLGIGA